MKTQYLLLAFLITLNIHATNYYVAKTGSDGNSGTEGQPWLTIQKAANTIYAGDTVFIKTGTYNEKVTPQNSGSAGNYITYAGYSNDLVIIDGQNSFPASGRWLGLFDVTQKNYIRIKKMRAVNSRFAGFFAAQADNIIFENLYASNTWYSGLVSLYNCSNITIASNEVVKACQGNNGSGDLQECITVSGCNTFEIKYNHVHDRSFPNDTNGGEGIDAKDASSNGKIFNNVVHDLGLELGIYVDAFNSTEENIEVYNNIVYNCYDGITLATEKNAGLLKNVKVYNNILYNNKFDGIIIATNDQDGPKENIYIYNNTIYSNGYYSSWGGGISVASVNNNNKEIVVKNNICSQNNVWQIMRTDSLITTVENNLIDGYRAYNDGKEEEVKGDNPVEADPKFSNLNSYNFSLLPDSPAIDSGTNTGLTAGDTDFDGNPRIIGGAVDIGAFEFVSNYTNPPAIPANLSASDGTELGAAHVTWDFTARATHFHVFRNVTNYLANATNLSGNVGFGTYIDDSVESTNAYFYWVRAVNNVGTSDFSNADSGFAKIGVIVSAEVWKLNKKQTKLKGKSISPLLGQYFTNNYGIGIIGIDGLYKPETKNNKVWKYKSEDKSIKIIYKEKLRKNKGDYKTKLIIKNKSVEIPGTFQVYSAQN